LIRFTGRPEYGDGLERTLYNTLLATRLPDSDGNYPYYSTYSTAAQKKYYHRKWPCCSGTLVQGVADYVLNAYFHDDESLMVNLFVSSEVDWERPGGKVVVAQETDYPAGDATRLTVRDAGDGRFAMKLRIPAWTDGASLRVNGKAVGVTPGTLATIDRRWKAGDVVDLVIPQPLRTLPIDTENRDIAALMRGAIMYVGLNPWQGIQEQVIDLPASLTPVSGMRQALRTTVDGRDLVFVPYFTIDTETYNTYFKIT
ncbi:MAG TPA: beta-L-arabinofuranosidase domain-containing protein, partial [Rhodothermales bacterium]